MVHHDKESQCPSCKSTNLSHLTEDITISYKGVNRILPNLEYIYCHTCAESFYTRNTEKKMDKETADFERNIDNLLTSEEIKSIRKKCGLTQEQLSQLLGMGVKTITRYENGTVIQNRATDLLLRLIRDNPSTVEHLKQYKLPEENNHVQQ